MLDSYSKLVLKKTMLKTNEYFDGNVKSIAFQTDTLPATVGVMAIKPKDDTNEISFDAGLSFEVPANSSFNVKVSVDTAYLCLYG